jgi:glycosyltransferase involved in cell wall biosynthesis
MWAGRLSRLKAPEVALDALAILRDRGIHVDLDIFAIGSPRERKLFRGRIDAAGLGDRVSMRSIRPGELVEHYHTYDCFLFTSRGDDPFPVTVQEAILSGLPCILSRSGGIPEAIGEREDCIYVRNGDAEDLAAGIERFLKLPDGGRALAEACIRGLRREGSFEKLRDHLESIA